LRKSKVSALTVSACNFFPPEASPETTPIPLASVAGAAGAGAGAAGASGIVKFVEERSLKKKISIYDFQKIITWGRCFSLGGGGLLGSSLYHQMKRLILISD